MEFLVTLFIFGQIPVTYADTTWPTYGGNLENTHFQKMVGAMETAPYVKWSYGTGGMVESYGAAVADVDGDGATEVVIGSNSNKVFCLSGVTGNLKWSYTIVGSIYSSPATADVDGDGVMEVVFGSNNNNIYCLSGTNGGSEWIYTTGDDVISSPAIADVDGDGAMEVIFGSYDNKIYCLNGANGGVEWSYVTGGDVRSSPAIADVDSDGTLEVVVVGWDNKVYCLSGATGALEWSYMTGGNLYSSPAIADVDGDGVMEIVFGNADSKVYCLSGATGALEWSYIAGNQVCSSPAIADVDGDGTIEIMVGSNDSTVYCLNGVTGGIKWSYYGGGRIHRGISVADLDGDVSGECKLEVLIPNQDSNLLTCLNGEDGSVLWTKELAKDIHDVTIADIDDDGCVELIVGTQAWSALWALDDVGDHSDCICDSSNSVEESSTRSYGIEFRSMGKGVYLFTPNAVQVDINVYDVSGKLEQTIYKGVLSKGGHTFMPNIKSSGVYFVTLQSHNFKQSLKLIRF